jgi:hypothetical protein
MTNSIFILICKDALRKIGSMNREPKPRMQAVSSDRTFDAFEELQRRGINPSLLCCAVCEVERIWKMKPGSDLKALADLGFSPKQIKTMARSLKDEADKLEKLHKEGFVHLGDSSEWSKSFFVQMRNVADALDNNCGMYPRNTRQNIHAAALVKLISETKGAAEWAGATYKHKEFPIKKLASDLMRQGVPENILKKLRADFPDSMGQIKDFPNLAALKQRIRTLAQKYDKDVASLCQSWITRFDHHPRTWVKGRTAVGPAPPLAMLPKKHPPERPLHKRSRVLFDARGFRIWESHELPGRKQVITRRSRKSLPKHPPKTPA